LSIERHRDFDRLSQEWEDLADRVRTMPWVRPGWLSAWWRAFGKGSLEIFSVRRGKRLAGVLPLCRRFGAFRSLTNYHTPQFAVLAEDETVARTLLSAALAGCAHQVALGFLRPEEAALQEDWSTANGHRVFQRTLLRSPYVPIECSWADYTRRLGGKFLGELRRRRRLLDTQGRLVFQVEDGRERLEELLAEGFRVEASGWKGTAGSAITARRETQQFYQDVARWAAPRGLLRLAFLRLDDRPLAFDYCLEDCGIHYLLKTGYDPTYGKLGTGMLLRYEMLARAFAQRFTSYEFLGADAPWKRRWADTRRERILLQVFASSLAGVLQWGAVRYGWSFARSFARSLACKGNQ
jgi:CelD/BcsL family acetyltransferase involved in cellulose biosynthesis